MYLYKPDLNYTNFFLFDKTLINNMQWAELPSSSKAVFPVIVSFCNEKGESFPSEETIAILSGLSEKTVRHGIKNLDGFSGFKVFRYTSKRGKKANKYFIRSAPNERDKSFAFFKNVFESAQWYSISPSGKALYPVMRHFVFFDIKIYKASAGEEPDPLEIEEIYQNRQFDYCEADKDVLASYSGISKRSMNEALKSLEDNFLIEPLFEHNVWKVFLIPQKYKKREYINDVILSRYSDKKPSLKKLPLSN